MNTPISFELSKMLKEKGFDSVTCKQGYHGDFGDLEGDEYPFLGTYTFIQDCLIRNNCDWKIQAPTIAEVVMWLFENHGIWIVVNLDLIARWYYDTYTIKGGLPNHNTYKKIKSKFNTPTEAYEAGVEYVLKNLI